MNREKFNKWFEKGMDKLSIVNYPLGAQVRYPVIEEIAYNAYRKGRQDLRNEQREEIKEILDQEEVRRHLKEQSDEEM